MNYSKSQVKVAIVESAPPTLQMVKEDISKLDYELFSHKRGVPVT